MPLLLAMQELSNKESRNESDTLGSTHRKPKSLRPAGETWALGANERRLMQQRPGERQKPKLWTALGRGIRRRCPNCERLKFRC